MGTSNNKYTYNERQLEVAVTSDICEVIDTPRSLTVFLLIKYEEWDQLVNLPIVANNYNESFAFANDYLVTAMLKKSDNVPLGIDTYAVALENFYDSEEICLETNDRLLDRCTEWPAKAIRAIEIFQGILGPLGQEELTYVQDHFSFGPGAVNGNGGNGRVLSDKFDSTICLTERLIPFFKSVVGDTWHSTMFDPDFHTYRGPFITRGSYLSSVSKNAKTRRGICIEPSVNLLFQKGAGALLRKRLRLNGCNINTQECNQFLAQRAYFDDLCTVDIVKASDTKSLSLVSEFCSDSWFHLLLLGRCDYTTDMDSCDERGFPKHIKLEKFSSMGNGFTFELETAVFLSVARACVPRAEWSSVSVYGDDIIIPRRYYDDLVATLAFLGFSVNMEKSFREGAFFESCGSDFFKGDEVRPFFLNRTSEDEKSIPYALQIANKLRIWMKRVYGYSDIAFKHIWKKLFHSVPRCWRHAIPEVLGDTGFIVSLEEAKPRRARGKPRTIALRDGEFAGLEGFEVTAMMQAPKKIRSCTMGVLLAALMPGQNEYRQFRNIPATLLLYESTQVGLFTKGFEPIRGYLRKPRSGPIVVRHWDQGYEWL